MARARNIKPGFFANEKLAECDPLARLLFAGLWCLADREGRLEDRPKRIRAEVLPYDVCDADALLDQLQQHGFILRYEACEHRCIQVLNFDKHQNPHMKEAKSSLPAPCVDDADNGSSGASPEQAPDEHSASMVQEQEEHQKSPAESGFLIPDSGSLIPDSLIPDPLKVADKSATAGKPPRGPGKRAAVPSIDGVPDSLFAEWLQVRKAKKAGPVSQTVVDALQREAGAAGITVEQAVRTCVERGWQGFNAEWLRKAPIRPAMRSFDPGAPVETYAQRAARQRVEEVSPMAARKAPGAGFEAAQRFMNGGDVIDVTPRVQPQLEIDGGSYGR